MNIILIRKKTGISYNINLPRPFLLSILVLLLCVPVVSYYFGFRANTKDLMPLSELRTAEDLKPVKDKLAHLISSIYKDELALQKKELQEIKQYNQDMVQSLMMKIARLQAHIIRLDSLGSRLTDVAQLDKKAFNFNYEPAIGGADSLDEETNGLQENNVNSHLSYLFERLNQISQEIDDKTQQLTILEKLLVAEQFQKTITPAGKPAENGWISSYFGMRKDPFTGRKKMHHGVDVAAKPGSSILATAAGIVTFVGTQTGYGKVLDIDHGYGISTRYGHNKSVLVKPGDIVKQGQIIALMGSTGRSTGSHVHYEVLRNGHRVNPGKYIVTAAKN